MHTAHVPAPHDHNQHNQVCAFLNLFPSPSSKHLQKPAFTPTRHLYGNPLPPHYLWPHTSAGLTHTQNASHIHTPPLSLDHAMRVSWYWRKPQGVPTYTHKPCFDHNTLNIYDTTSHGFLPVLQASPHALRNSLVLLMGIMMSETCWELINQEINTWLLWRLVGSIMYLR